MLMQKIGKMLIMGFQGVASPSFESIIQAINRRQLGGVILFGQNIKNPAQLSALTSELKRVAANAGYKKLLIALDYEGGTVERLLTNAGFPPTLSAARLGMMSDEEVAHHAAQMARTLSAAGINLNFAPIVDVNVYPENPIIGKRERSFAADPKRVAECAAIFASVYRDHGIISVFKHFPGHGSSHGDTHAGFVDVTNTWQACELVPYQKLLPTYADTSMVMMAHVVHRALDPAGLPASLSAAMVQSLLRQRLHFSGVVVSDDLQMGAITKEYGIAAALPLAINAGVDMLILGNQLTTTCDTPEDIIQLIYKEVMDGKISERKISEAVLRVDHLLG